MKVSFIRSPREWDLFVASSNGSFLQSTMWSSFKGSYHDYYQLESVEGEEIKGVCQFFKYTTPFGSYFYAPYGPVASSPEHATALVAEAKQVAVKENCFFIRCEPVSKMTAGVPAIKRAQPQQTIVVDINKGNEELLMTFSPSTRRNIRSAEKNNISISRENDVDDLSRLINETTKRKGFSSYNKDYFDNLLKKTDAELVTARYKGKTISANITVYFGKTATCLFSGNDYRFKKIQSSSLLRFSTMLRARERGMLKFDAWGVDDDRFPGVSDFKKGFGGTTVIYPQGFDLPIKKIHYKTYATIIKVLRRNV